MPPQYPGSRRKIAQRCIPKIYPDITKIADATTARSSEYLLRAYHPPRLTLPTNKMITFEYSWLDGAGSSWHAHRRTGRACEPSATARSLKRTRTDQNAPPLRSCTTHIGPWRQLYARFARLRRRRHAPVSVVDADLLGRALSTRLANPIKSPHRGSQPKAYCAPATTRARIASGRGQIHAPPRFPGPPLRAKPDRPKGLHRESGAHIARQWIAKSRRPSRIAPGSYQPPTPRPGPTPALGRASRSGDRLGS
ncbi:hypothetical protein HYPSUDRAFT_196370 [Hypholoma sublateritium FD-334 SS-4]|uniref:Uncharacterized protein n=1 Tax=Hypholoma sublateritium (strain FD-334 SS-4) TaxID=945553 RepID=A0A0D2PGY0_HYPSF|nr:hypothetical protein HYPSUDRAFT_196370 [Hypholoma sublateritium FD-334 SS-4]